MDEYLKASWDEAPFKIWLDIIKGYPDMRKWVAHKKSIPVEIMEILAGDADDRVRFIVAAKNRHPGQLKLANDSRSSVRIG